MQNQVFPTTGLSGTYRDVLYDADGRVTSDSGWQKNTIVLDCRRVIASLMIGKHNANGASGITGIRFGMGAPTWDSTPPRPSPNDTRLVDENFYEVPVIAAAPNSPSVQLAFVVSGSTNTSTEPTNTIQVVATLPPGYPKWPDKFHVDGTLREFGLVGILAKADGTNDSTVLLNAVRHAAIPKSPEDTLVRTIQLVF